MRKKKIIIPIVIVSCILILCLFFILTNKSSYENDFSYLSTLQLRKSDWPCAQSPDSVWVPENVKFKNGMMTLAVKNTHNNLTNGEVSLKKNFGFGLYQVRMMPISNSGVVSSFFIYSKKDNMGTEIDIEFLGYDTTKVQFNYYTNDGEGHEYLYDLGFDASEDFHTYAFNWTSDAIYWYVDGELVYEMHENDIPQMKAQIIMDAWAGGDENWVGKYDGNSPLYAYYDWFSYTSPAQ